MRISDWSSDVCSSDLKSISNPVFGAYLNPEPKTLSVEMPTARAGYSILSGKLPFSVVPGNHDYDSVWSDARWPATADAASPLRYGMLHYGGLDNFRSVFGRDRKSTRLNSSH